MLCIQSIYQSEQQAVLMRKNEEASAFKLEGLPTMQEIQLVQMFFSLTASIGSFSVEKGT